MSPPVAAGAANPGPKNSVGKFQSGSFTYRIELYEGTTPVGVFTLAQAQGDSSVYTMESDLNTTPPIAGAADNGGRPSSRPVTSWTTSPALLSFYGCALVEVAGLPIS